MHDEYLKDESTKDTKEQRHFSMFAKPDPNSSPRTKNGVSSPIRADISLRSTPQNSSDVSNTNPANVSADSEAVSSNLIVNGEKFTGKSNTADKIDRDNRDGAHTLDGAGKSEEDKDRLHSESKSDNMTGASTSDQSDKSLADKHRLDSAANESDTDKRRGENETNKKHTDKQKREVTSSGSQIPGCSGEQDSRSSGGFNTSDVLNIKDISGCDSCGNKSDTCSPDSTPIKERNNVKIFENASGRNSVESTPTRDIESGLDTDKKQRNGITVEERKMRIKRSLSPGFYSEDVFRLKKQRKENDSIIACKHFS